MFDKDLFLSLCDKYDVKFSETANEPTMCENNKKLVQHIKMDMTGIPKQGMYCYGEASLETNMEMQEPLEKLYKYENQLDMREKLKEYISELDEEYDRCRKLIEEKLSNIQDDEEKEIYCFSIEYITLKTRIITLSEVKNDLQSRLDELI